MLRTVLLYYVVSCLSAVAFGGLAYYFYRLGEDDYRATLGDHHGAPPVAKKGPRLKPADVRLQTRPDSSEGIN